MKLEERLVEGKLLEAEQKLLASEVQEIAIRQSLYIDRPNFQAIHPDDLRRLFDLYDDRYFQGRCRQAVGDRPLSFRLSKRMTSAGGKTVREALMQLTEKYPTIKRHLFADDGALRSFVNVYVNDEDIRYLKKGETSVTDSDLISIIPSIAGGSGKNSTGRLPMLSLTPSV